MATAKEISKRLNVSFHTLSKWREEGLPFEKVKGVFQYDPVCVASWLLETGKATREGQSPKTDDVGPVMTKIRECAVFFGVHERTVKGWLQDPSFPGRAGKRGDPNTAKGHFPAKSIAIWLQQSGKRSKVQIPVSLQLPDATTQPVQPTARDRLVDVKTEQAMLELKRMQGKMVDAEEALAFYRRTNAYAVTVLKSLPSQLQSALPANVDERTRAAIYQVALKVVNQARKMLAELIEGDADRPNHERSD